MMMDMPGSAPEMRRHMEADPPAGHGVDASAGPMADMTQRHEAMHAKGAEHTHSPAGQSMKALKAEQVGSSRWRVLAIPFGGPFRGGKDLDGEFFDRQSDIKPRWFRERPVLFHHGKDAMLKGADLGIQELDDEPTDEGWWSTVWLNRAGRYWNMVDGLLRSGKMYGSSGAVSHLVRVDRKTGHIDVWPHAEQTLTPTPANPYARITAAKAIAGFDSAGIALPDDLRADLFADGEPSGDLFADGDAAAMKARALTSAERLRVRAAIRTNH